MIPYRLDPDPLPVLGLIVLRVDETIEQEFRQLFPPEAAKLLVSRVTSGEELTPETIASMQDGLASAAALLPPAAQFASVGYGCTSGTALIGAKRVVGAITSEVQTAHVSTPLTAAQRAFAALGLRRIGLVSPYIDAVAGPLAQALETPQTRITHSLSFGERHEANVARIAPASIMEAAGELAKKPGLDALFLSCTNLRTLGIIPQLEAELGLPVLSSNQVLAWDMAQAAGITGHVRIGRLMHTPT